MEDGVKGTLSASQVCVGVENGLSIRVYGETGGLEWHQEEPNTLKRTYADKPTEILRARKVTSLKGRKAGSERRRDILKAILRLSRIVIVNLAKP